MSDLHAETAALRERCGELAAKLVDCEGLRLADEQTIRNLEAALRELMTALHDPLPTPRVPAAIRKAHALLAAQSPEGKG